QLYQGRLHEAVGQQAAAEAVYRHLLRTATGSKITVQARQGLHRLEAFEREQRQRSLAQATREPRDTELGLLVLEPVPAEAKSLAAKNFAQIMKIDLYSAQLQLPTHSWRLYRTGLIGELRFYGQALQAAGISAFWFSLPDIRQVQVLQVRYLQADASQVTAVYQNEAAETGSFTFAWSEVTQLVEGLLPLFEEVLDLDARGRLHRKLKTQDHAQVCDLHLPSKQCILRLVDANYQFQHGINLVAGDASVLSNQNTSWANWKRLMGLLTRCLPQTPVSSNFNFFAESALEHIDRLKLSQSHINLFRRIESEWDVAFHLYSCLVFLKRNSSILS
ncbi:MAG TPA: hypothetical protein V6D03_12700, partial [Candidatus Caenarcaniphilales bacterium]